MQRQMQRQRERHRERQRERHVFTHIYRFLCFHFLEGSFGFLLHVFIFLFIHLSCTHTHTLTPSRKWKRRLERTRRQSGSREIESERVARQTVTPILRRERDIELAEREKE